MMKGNDIIEYLEAHPEDEDKDIHLLIEKTFEWKWGEKNNE